MMLGEEQGDYFAAFLVVARLAVGFLPSARAMRRAQWACMGLGLIRPNLKRLICASRLATPKCVATKSPGTPCATTSNTAVETTQPFPVA